MYNGKKIVALIQVRLSSSRLPNKALIPIDGIPVIERVINSIQKSKYVDKIIVATSNDKSDMPLVDFLKSKKYDYHCGDLLNIVKRFIDAASNYNPDYIVRATGDCPLTSFEIIDYFIKSHNKTNSDYTSTEYGKCTVGTMSEIISYPALLKLYNYKLDFSYSEYMTYYFRNNPNHFNINLIDIPEMYNYPDFRLTLDYPEDLELLQKLYKILRKKKLELNLMNSINILKKMPDLARINSHLGLIFRTDTNLINKLNTVTKI